ncbi:hypothetical protein BGW80DRAFT_794373 [Lactifluus volemus]|nr:hypothetical protein BGW80DRAFT_794373 [Lactifluus volemus]
MEDEDLMSEIRGSEKGIEPYHLHAPTRYSGYQAILGKLSYHVTSTQPRVRWAVIFSGVAYIIIYIPRTPERPVFHCSPVMTFCVRPGKEPDAQAPPLWSLLVYMLLTERFNVSDDILRQQLHIPVPSGYGSTSGSTYDAERRNKSSVSSTRLI